ncbi:MAG: SMI1/KNR4 family protein [Planctomycetaceae bacterium]
MFHEAAAKMYAAFMSELCRFMIDAEIATDETIRGCTDAELRQLEQQLSISLPISMAECLRQIGHACGRLMDGDLFGADAFEGAREVAVELTAAKDSPWRLPEHMIPYLQHQGYEFLFVDPHAGDDPPVWLYVETEPEPKEWAPSFTAWLREAAISAVECKPWNEEVCREISLHRDDWTSRRKTLDEYDSEAGQIRRSLIARLSQRDRELGRITGPIEFQEIWNREFPQSELCRKLNTEGKRIPWGWISPREA